MNPVIKIKVGPGGRTLIVAALMAYHCDSLANEIADLPLVDSADDGPEVTILSVERGG
jgi:hypothetical protein